MGTGNLPTTATVASGLKILSADFLSVISALQGSFVPRNTSGVPTAGESLGTALYYWGNIHASSLTLNGETVDLSGLVSPANRIVSGATRTTSGQPQFLEPAGSSASVDILGLTTNLVLSINSTTVTVSTDITKSSLTTAPASNNTCLINDSYFADQAESKYFGEIDSDRPIIPIDTAGSEITGRVGQFISLKTATSEIMFGWLKSTTEFVNVYRGFFFDSSLNPIVRETIANNDTLTLLETGWIFVENDGTSADVTYTTPAYSYDAPSSPSAGDYWYDISNNEWKEYDSSWASSNRMLVGICVMDTSNCIGARSFDFYQDFKDTNTLEVEIFSDEVARTSTKSNIVNVYGTDLRINNYPVEWDNTADMETGSVSNDVEYYLYLSTDGEPYISTERPYKRDDLLGRYHPYNNWRYIAKAVTDYNSDWLRVDGDETNKHYSAQWEEEGLEIEVTSVTQATIKFKRLTLLNERGQTKTLYNGNLTADITVHNQGTELASTWYQIWIDWMWNIKLVPDLTGTATTDTADKLIDSGATFRTYGAEKGDEAYNQDDNTNGDVDSNDSETQLGFSTDLFPDGNEDYTIHMLNQVGLGSYKGNIGAVYNDSGSDLDATAYQRGRWHFHTDISILSSGAQTSYTALDLSAVVPVTAKEVLLRGGAAIAATSEGFLLSTDGTNDYTRNYHTSPTGNISIITNFHLVLKYTQKIWYKVTAGASNAESHVYGFKI